MARFAIRLPVIFANFGQRQFADDRDAMVHPLAVGDDMLLAQPPQHLGREQAAFDLGFLKAEDVGSFFAQEFLDEADARATAVDVPRSVADRTSVLLGYSVSVRVDIGGSRIIKNKRTNK